MPPAYEVLLLNTAIPQIQAAQSGDTYVVPRDIAFSAALTLSAGTANGVPYLNASKVLTTGSALTFDGTNLNLGVNGATIYWTAAGNNVAINTSSGVLGFYTGTSSYGLAQQINADGTTLWKVGGSEAMRLTSTGLGIGTNAPNTILSVNAGDGVGVLSPVITTQSSTTTYGGMYAVRDGAGDQRGLVWQTFTANVGLGEKMRLDSSGNVGIGTNNPGAKLDVNGTIYSRTGGVYTDTLTAYSGSSISVNAGSSYFAVTVNGNERARITSGGDLLVGVTSAITIDGTAVNHAFQGSTNGFAVGIQNTNNSTPLGLAIKYTAAAPNGTGSQFLYCSDNLGVNRAEIRSNGGLANYQANDVNLSDQRVKKDIVAAPSYWDKIKGIEIVHFKYKDQTHDDNNVGVIAQQVEQVAPEFVDQDGWGETPEDGVPLKSIYTSDMYHAAIKALQEAMARIEKLEAEVAALKGA